MAAEMTTCPTRGTCSVIGNKNEHNITQSMSTTHTGRIPSAISVALQSNVSVQVELRRRLLQIKHEKIQNRCHAAKICASIPPSHFREEDVNIDHVAGTTQPCSECIVEVDNDLEPKVVIAPRNKMKTKPKKSNGVSQNAPKRKFFVDQVDGSTPEVTWSGNLERDSNRPSTRVIFERNTQSSVTLEEEPQNAWTNIKKMRNNLTAASCEEVTMRIENNSSALQPDVLQIPPEGGTLTNHFSFVDTKMAKLKFTKQEISKLSDTEKRGIDWYDIATKCYAKFQKEEQTPWQCFCQYRSSIKNSTTLSPDEDELLLKYLAVQGPQYLLQNESVVQTCRNLFPHHKMTHLTKRCNSTLLNPSFSNLGWSTDEKRKLAILMRVYSNEPSPSNLASHTVHFPNRSSQSVTEKWVRVVQPEDVAGPRKKKSKRSNTKDA